MSGDRGADLVDLAGLNSWFQTIRTGKPPFTRIWPISGGRSNLTFGLADEAGKQYCLRRPPQGVLVASAHDVLREYRIMAALQDSAVPVPRTVAAADHDVLGFDFYLTEFVVGPVDATELSGRARHDLADALVDALVAIHEVDVDAVGLDGLLRPGSYVARQTRRWMSQLTEADRRRRPAFGLVHDALQAAEPIEDRRALVHGDFKLGNLILRTDGGVAAVLDWELSTTGDPLADVGWLLASWSDADSDAPRIVIPPNRAGGFATKDELTRRYAGRTGRELHDVAYYEALAEWRWACIDLGVGKRFAAGAMTGQTIDPELVDAEIDDRLSRAAELLSISAAV